MLRYEIRMLIVLIVIISAAAGLAQDKVIFEQLTIENGLSQNSVTCMLQDRRGFMWFGTNHGLNKYDGYNITIYTHNAFDLNTLSDNWITVIHEDEEGILWIGTKDGGLNRFDKYSGIVTRYQHRPDSRLGISSNRIVSISEDEQGFLWIGTEDAGLNKFDKKTEEFLHYKAEPGTANSLSSDRILDVYPDFTNSLLWIGTDGGGLNRFNIHTGEVRHFKNMPGNMNSLSNDVVNSVYKDSKGLLWIGTGGGGLNRFDTVNGTFIRFKHDPRSSTSISEDYITSVFEDRTGKLWVGTRREGVNRFDGSRGFTVFKNNPNDKFSINSNNIDTIFEDRSGILWIGTEAGGANKYCRYKIKFDLMQHDPENRNSLSDNGIWHIFEDNEKILWVGTNGGGLDRIDRERNIYTHYRHSPSDPVSISNNVVNCIIETETGEMWISTDDGLNKFDKENGIFRIYKNIPGDPESIHFNDIGDIAADESGNLWLASWGAGLIYYDREKDNFSRRISDPGDPNSLSNEKVVYLYLENDYLLWIGTNGGGLVRYNITTNEYRRYKTDPDDPVSISSNKVSYIHRHEITGDLWIGTSGGGLNKFDKVSEEFLHITEKDGLPDNMIYGLLEDGSGKFWISTNNGLVNFDPVDYTVNTFTVDDGLQSNEFNAGAFYWTKSGEMFFGGINGLNFFYPDSLKKNTYIPPVEIISIKVFDEPLEMESDISEIEVLELSHGENLLNFEFVALDYSNPEGNRYAYRLENVDRNWVYSSYRFANYVNLSPGEYTFLIRGANSDGVWNDEGASLRIKIIPPFWQTGWFRIIMILSVIGIILLTINVKSRQVRHQRTKLEDLVQQRTRALTEKQEELVKARDELELRVSERTSELSLKNVELEKEINERRRIEEELRLSEEDYRTLTENVNIGIYRRTKGINGKAIKVNPAMVKMFGYDSPEEMFKVRITDLYYDPEDLRRFNERMEMMGYARGEEIVYKKKDGSTFTGSVTVVAVRDENGEIIFYDGVIEDITERKNSEEVKKTLEEQLYQSQKLESIGRLAGGIAHDFNNILTGVMGFAEILKMKFTDKSTLESQAAEVIFKGSERAAELTRQLLGFARAGKYYPVPININEIIQDMVKVSEKIFEKNVKVIYDFDDMIKTVEADKNQLEQVFTNLIINAKDAMPDGGELAFTTNNVEIGDDFAKDYPEFKSGKYVKISVKDTGVGIPKNIIDQIFEPFFTTKEEGKGTGLGLSMVYGIIKNHYGYIYVESSRKKGTVFTIFLPVSNKEISDKENKNEDVKIGRETILVIDDEENVRSLAKSQLESIGYEVLLAGDGLDGLEKYKKHRDRIDLVLLDMIMPNMSGKDTLERLKRENENIKVIIISGYSKDIVSMKHSDMNVQGFIQKPFKISEMSTIISQVLIS
ncbi:two-component regulator propeller domain-containing protein [candidate division KSB1 bacterium]